MWRARLLSMAGSGAERTSCLRSMWKQLANGGNQHKRDALASSML